MSRMETTIKSVVQIFLFFCCIQALYAQCPPAALGHHRVQKGETLYKISKKYKVNVDQLSAWNGMQKNSILSICQELRVTPPALNNPQNPPFNPNNNAIPQQGGSHRIKPGETIAGLAELYGFTEQRFRHFNGLNPSEPAWPGLVLKTSDCICTDPQSEFDPVYTDIDNSDPSAKPAPTDPAFPTWEEAMAVNEENPATSGRTSPFGEDPFSESSPSIAIYKQEDKRTSTPSTYRKDSGKIIAPNSPHPTASKKATPTLDPKVRRSESGEGAPNRTYISPEEELIRKQRRMAPTTSRINPSPSEGPTVSKAVVRYMKADEVGMINEINLLRSNPSNYVKYIEEYKNNPANRRDSKTIAVCNELIAELKRTPPLAILEPKECLYNAAKKHGEDQKRKGSTDHVGTDGSYPWDRVRRECPFMTDGQENLVAGPNNVRDCIIILLLDKNVTNRVHRRTILKKDWKYVACYNIGQRGLLKSDWIQKFGK